MTWKIEIVALVRGLIDDYGMTTTYEDDQLEEIICYTAPFVTNENTFDRTYTIDLVGLNISPDPTDYSPKDMNFMALVALKTAISILRGELKTAAAQSIKVVDGPSTIEAQGIFQAKKQLYDDLVKDYKMLRVQHQIGNGSAGKAILSPYTQSNLGFRSPFYTGE